MDLGAIAIRAAAAYAMLHLLLRLSGKRTVAEATSFDFVLAIVVGDLVDDLVLSEVTVAQFAVAAGTLFAVHGLLALATAHSVTWLGLVEGKPVVLMESGETMARACRSEQISGRDLDHILRNQGIGEGGRSDVRLLIMEVDSEISVLHEEGAEPLRRRDLAATEKALS